MHTSTRLDLQIRFKKPNIDISEQILSSRTSLVGSLAVGLEVSLEE